AAVLAGNGRYRALEDILARARPRLAGGFSGPIQTMDLREQRERAAALDQNYLFIQGPPGTGKTWTGARIVVDLIRRAQRVGVAATSHKGSTTCSTRSARPPARKVCRSAVSRNKRVELETEYDKGDWVVNVGDT